MMRNFNFTQKQKEAIKLLNNIHNTHNELLNDGNYFLLMEFVVGNGDIVRLNEEWTTRGFDDRLFDTDFFKTHGVERCLKTTCCHDKD